MSIVWNVSLLTRKSSLGLCELRGGRIHKNQGACLQLPPINKLPTRTGEEEVRTAPCSIQGGRVAFPAKATQHLLWCCGPRGDVGEGDTGTPPCLCQVSFPPKNLAKWDYQSHRIDKENKSQTSPSLSPKPHSLVGGRESVTVSFVSFSVEWYCTVAPGLTGHRYLVGTLQHPVGKADFIQSRRVPPLTRGSPRKLQHYVSSTITAILSCSGRSPAMVQVSVCVILWGRHLLTCNCKVIY